MTTPLLIEEESGTSVGRSHPHNGYYAGDFSDRPVRRRATPRKLTAPLQPVVRS